MRSAHSLGGQDPGFEADRLLVAQVQLPRASYGDSAERLAFFRSLIERIGAQPSVEAVGGIEAFFLNRFPDLRIKVAGAPPPEPGQATPRLTSDGAFPGFFEAVGLGLVQGRLFEASDGNEEAERVAVVNQAMARTFFPNRSAIDQLFEWGDGDGTRMIRIVGVVDDMRQVALAEPPVPHVYTPAGERSLGLTQIDLVVRASGDPLSLVPEIRALLADLDPDVPLANVRTADAVYGSGVAQKRFQALMFALFAGLATILAAVGLYALLHEAVTSRRRDIGIRMALGAGAHQIARQVVRRSVGVVGLGVLFGLALALAMSGLVRGLLYGIEPTDPLTLALVGSLLLGVAAGAAWIPARTAVRVDPVETLAGE